MLLHALLVVYPPYLWIYIPHFVKFHKKMRYSAEYRITPFHLSHTTHYARTGGDRRAMRNPIMNNPLMIAAVTIMAVAYPVVTSA